MHRQEKDTHIRWLSLGKAITVEQWGQAGLPRGDKRCGWPTVPGDAAARAVTSRKGACINMVASVCRVAAKVLRVPDDRSGALLSSFNPVRLCAGPAKDKERVSHATISSAQFNVKFAVPIPHR